MTFFVALREHFKLTIEEEQEAFEAFEATPVARLFKLTQGSHEGLWQYYEHARDLLLALYGHDDDNEALTPAERTLRTIIVSRFRAGLSNLELRNRLNQQQLHLNEVRLYQAFRIVEAENKIMNMEKEKEEHSKKVWGKKKRKAASDEDPNNTKKRKRAVKPKIPSAHVCDGSE